MLKWFPCEMHCHTLHSDGKFTVESLMQTAKEYGLSGIALTDHNTVSGWDEITEEREKKYVSVLKGIEWTTFFGHMLVTDCKEFVDWRDAVPDNIDEKIAEVKKPAPNRPTWKKAEGSNSLLKASSNCWNSMERVARAA